MLFIFFLQNGSLFYWHFYENMQQSNNRVDNFESIYCTLALICIEMGGDDILIELFRLALGIQVRKFLPALTRIGVIHLTVSSALALRRNIFLLRQNANASKKS